MVTTPIFLYHGDFYHLWYLSSMLIGCLFIAVCYRYNAKILIPIVSIIAIAASIVASGYQILPHDFELGTAIPKYWRSIPLLYMGFFIYRKGVPAWWVSALLIIFGTALLPLEVKFVSWQYGHPAYQELLIGTIPVGVGMACLALNNLSFLQHPLLARWGRDYSLGIYLIHPIIINLIGYIPFLVSSAIFILRNMIWQMLSPVAFLFLCIAALSAIRWYLPAVYNAMFGIRTSPQQN
jgi:surface polysaccharide O-acyltransferase-like enzyme